MTSLIKTFANEEFSIKDLSMKITNPKTKIVQFALRRHLDKEIDDDDGNDDDENPNKDDFTPPERISVSKKRTASIRPIAVGGFDRETNRALNRDTPVDKDPVNYTGKLRHLDVHGNPKVKQYEDTSTGKRKSGARQRSKGRGKGKKGSKSKHLRGDRDANDRRLFVD